MGDGEGQLGGEIAVGESVGPGELPGMLRLVHPQEEHLQLGSLEYGRPKQPRSLSARKYQHAAHEIDRSIERTKVMSASYLDDLRTYRNHGEASSAPLAEDE